MQVIENENIVVIDTDETLVLWSEPTIPSTDKIKIKFAGKSVYLTPHNYHIDLLKMYKERGYFVIVWSNNGNKHSKQVVTALGLTDYVDMILSKPLKHLDDRTEASEIIGNRVYCSDITKPVKYFVPAGTILSI